MDGEREGGIEVRSNTSFIYHCISVKEQWNDQVADVAHRIIHADVSGRAKKMWDENVAPNLK